MINNSQWGGCRPDSGRPRRPEPKALSIWCGQMSPGDRQLIIDNLTPQERYEALMRAVEKKR